MQVSVATERDPCPNQDSTTSITVSFNSVGLMVSSALFPQISRRPESLSIVNDSLNSTEAHCCCVQETCSLAQHKRFPSLSSVEGNAHNWSSCIQKDDFSYIRAERAENGLLQVL
ncbi:hypothetical protein TNCV_628131 [Trichonephila clavipes]|nr:hypothetical protein TNCV_628131 [Trichonephila clavipes]